MTNCSFVCCSHPTPANLSDQTRQDVQALMQPGLLSLAGFLKKDVEDLLEVFEADRKALESIQVTHFQVGEALRQIADMAIQASTTPLPLEGRLSVDVNHNEDEGMVSCPFSPDSDTCHEGKRLFTITNTRSGESIRVAELTIGLIRDHGFFEGNTAYRVDPLQACRVLGLC